MWEWCSTAVLTLLLLCCHVCQNSATELHIERSALQLAVINVCCVCLALRSPAPLAVHTSNRASNNTVVCCHTGCCCCVARSLTKA